MTAAVFGLLGVIVGGLITGAVDYVAKRREEQAVLRSLARALTSALMTLQSQATYCRDLRSWLLVAEPLVLPDAWTENEMLLGRLLSWDEWVGLEAVVTSQLALRTLAAQAQRQPGLEQTHLPTVTKAAIAAIDNVLPSLSRLAGDPRAA
jgi:hypothetical protein